ncbi:MAG: hypothetical protein S4CHLAM81_05540 [Chlamydiales bacterium]|nr:hypothetical protein [Chlamydiales bacterium]MCH9635339.1 hypothetical protein [Chlamydiales bacterium]MCH9703328.1 hypothetical protein [Chlamydiota bacterium]
MQIDILSNSFEAKRLHKELKSLGVSCQLIGDLGSYLYEVRAKRPDWTLAFDDLLGWATPLCDILNIPHFHWERDSLDSLDHLLQSKLCEVGFYEKLEGVHHLPFPIEATLSTRKLFETALFVDLDETTFDFINSFEGRVDLFGKHRGRDWFLRLPRNVHLHAKLPLEEMQRVIGLSQRSFLGRQELTKKFLEEHSWRVKTEELLKCLSL